jgi:hypothetical protein
MATSCAPVYIPNARNTPMFKGAGEIQAGIQISQGIDVQTAVAVTDHIGIMANFSSTNHTTVDNDEDYIKHRFFEGAVGYYENTGKLFYEIYGGYGRGKGTAYDTYDFTSSSPVKATGEYNRFFIQPSFGMNQKVFNWSVSARFSWVDFVSLNTDAQPVSIDADPVLFIEPAFTGRINFGSSKIFMAFQTGISFPQTNTFFEYEPFFASIGMGLRLGGKDAQKKEE